MLDSNDLERLFEQARSAGFENCEVYCESAHSVSLSYFGRTDSIRFLTRRGISFRGRRDGIGQHFFADGIDTQALLSALQGSPPSASLLSNRSFDCALPKELAEGASNLLQTIRGAFSSQNENLVFSEAKAVLSRKIYQVAREAEPLGEGTEETAELHAQWFVGQNPHLWERARGSIAGLLGEASAAGSLAAAVKRSLAPSPLWPAPRGQVPVLWSARSVAKLQMLWLRAFEGDRVLGNRSLLNELELPLKFLFTLEDRPPTDSPIDHEGSARKTVVLFRDGRPTALACNKEIAGLLEVPPTGHARRESFENAPTVGFWHPYIKGIPQSESLLAMMEKGITVRDVEVLQYDPAIGEVRFRLLDARLVHHGAEGELVEPLVLTAKLVDLLASLECFEATSHTTGLVHFKESQRLYTEVTAPAALSKPIHLPGSVPLEHYW